MERVYVDKDPRYIVYGPTRNTRHTYLSILCPTCNTVGPALSTGAQSIRPHKTTTTTFLRSAPRCETAKWPPLKRELDRREAARSQDRNGDVRRV